MELKMVTVLVYMSLFFLCMHTAYADLESTNYSIGNYTIGTQTTGGMSSPNYSMTSGVGNTYTVSIDGEDEDASPRGGNGRGRGNGVTTTPSVQDVIFGAVENSPFGDTPLPRVEIARAYDALVRAGNDATTTEFDRSEVVTDARGDESVLKKLKGSALVATLASGDFDAFINELHATYTRLFEDLGARLSFFVFVLLVLAYLRRFTEVGRRYAPF